MNLRTTPLHPWHARRGARLVDFAGWSMPVQYDSIVNEHLAVRSVMGLFDVSHMGRIYFRGADAPAFLDSLVTRRVQDLREGQIRYALMCNEQGGVLDDVLVYRLPAALPDTHLLVVNAGNREKILHWMDRHRAGFSDLAWEDRTESTAMIAVQGPRAITAIQPRLNIDLTQLSYYHGTHAQFEGHPLYVSRTGYTGEDGCELIVPADVAEPVWNQCLAADPGARPAGLGARDTLRLEAAMPLYGHELLETIDPFQAGLGFAVNLKERDFIGKRALVQRKADATLPRRVGLALDGKRPAREHYPVYSGSEEIGKVTSGTISPSLGYPIAMAYLLPDWTSPRTTVEIDLRGTRAAATVVPLPFYQRSR